MDVQLGTRPSRKSRDLNLVVVNNNHSPSTMPYFCARGYVKEGHVGQP